MRASTLLMVLTRLSKPGFFCLREQAVRGITTKPDGESCPLRAVAPGTPPTLMRRRRGVSDALPLAQDVAHEPDGGHSAQVAAVLAKGNRR